MEIDIKLLGTWNIDPKDSESLKQMGKVTMTFQEDNILKYIVQDKGTIQISSLTYWIEKGFIKTIQLPSKDEESTAYVLENTQVLLLTKDKLTSKFLKSE